MSQQSYFIERLEELRKQKQQEIENDYWTLAYSDYRFPDEGVVRRLLGTRTYSIPLHDILQQGFNWSDIKVLKPYIAKAKQIRRSQQAMAKSRTEYMNKELQKIKDEGVLSKTFAEAITKFSKAKF